MKVLKFGGSVLKNAKDVVNVVDIINKQVSNSNAVAVVSAFYGITNTLLALHGALVKQENAYKIYEKIAEYHFDVIQQLDLMSEEKVKEQVLTLLQELKQSLDTVIDKNNCAERKDCILSFGERLSSVIIYHYLAKINGYDNVAYVNIIDIIKTDDHFGHAIVDFAASAGLIKNSVAKISKKVAICAGFIASTNDGKITTLGRNGSDYTAALIASAANAEVLEIWKDTNGLYTADPKIVKDVKLIKQITYQEMAELSSLGNKVIHIGAISPCIIHEIPILLKNCYNIDAEGTLISSQEYTNYSINGVVKLDGVIVVSLILNELVNINDIAIELQKLLVDYNDIVITISQNIKQKKIAILIESNRANDFIADINNCIKKINKHLNVSITERKSMITVIGANFTRMAGIAGKILNVLGENNININALHDDFSPTRISFLCSIEDADRAVNLLHNAFVA